MKKYLWIVVASLILSSCFGIRPEFQQGMNERKFLRQNKEAVLSGIDGNIKVYRVQRDDRFFVLATFENGQLIKLEERELTPVWGPPIQNDEN
ncbi:hypothetical protein [Mongoliitalea daihaiensis]|uniref:hypothetical protein n=1 Tax=Mongoliitalea daihaiensis TaxID=2782006 RepID=UPI001F2D405F|nr:hypothetical protein [Mongoliitalea daihaiensis]UJP64566.1 hypothetical protein IPZ59_17435 [Mongoliitalea daihaiensis]